MDGLWATKSEGIEIIVRAISFQDFQPLWSWSTNVTDGRTTCNRNTALCAIVHRAYRSSRGSSSRCVMMHSVSVNHCPSWFSLSTSCHDVRVCGRPAAPKSLWKEQELSLQNVLSLSPVHLCGTLYLFTSPADRLETDAAVFRSKLKSYLSRSAFIQ